MRVSRDSTQPYLPPGISPAHFAGLSRAEQRTLGEALRQADRDSFVPQFGRTEAPERKKRGFLRRTAAAIGWGFGASALTFGTGVVLAITGTGFPIMLMAPLVGIGASIYGFCKK